MVTVGSKLYLSKSLLEVDAVNQQQLAGGCIHTALALSISLFLQ